ncbi:MAG: hypothetical protein E6K71_07210 [Candidatus Eisenbacteria bacterium]|uniref:TldD/PmbA family protein n=1 Tax=Eiseniibacteriota bacterium TaxID=2212470 RepID=A0A538SAP6_UNCEI|nr:MAG: hypothetical protein E6K71_07210 [Candidatus Eisenbacteria bacterium]
MEAVGCRELRQGAAGPGRRDHARSRPRALPEGAGGRGVRGLMLREEAKAKLDQAISLARGAEVEVMLGGGSDALTRFANNEITQNVEERRYLLSVRIVEGKRTGRATGNDLSPKGMAQLIERAKEATRHQPEIPELLPLPGPQTYRTVDALDPETERLSADARAREVGKAVTRCREAGLEGAGIYEVRAGTIGDYGEIGPLAIANSRGLFAYHEGTSAEFLVSALDGTASGWAGYESHSARGVDGGALSSRAVEKALRSREPKPWDPGRYTVVLEPAAVADLLQDMSWISFGALLVQEGPRRSSSVGWRRARSTTGRPPRRRGARARDTGCPFPTPTGPSRGIWSSKEDPGAWKTWSGAWTGGCSSRGSGTPTSWIPRR